MDLNNISAALDIDVRRCGRIIGLAISREVGASERLRLAVAPINVQLEVGVDRVVRKERNADDEIALIIDSRLNLERPRVRTNRNRLWVGVGVGVGVGDENVVFVNDVVRQEHALVERLKL